MARRNDNPLARLDRDLADLKLLEIAKHYREVLDEAARKGSSMLDVLITLIGLEQTSRNQRALERRLHQARLPKQRTLAEYKFDFPKRVPKAAIPRLFDCDFIERHGCALLIGPTGTGKSHLLTALGYTACERGYSVRHTRVIDMINHLVMAQTNGLLGKAILAILSRHAVAREERIGGGPVHHARLTELERLAGPSAPRLVPPHLAADLTSRIQERAERRRRTRRSQRTSSARTRGSVISLETGSGSPIGPSPMALVPSQGSEAAIRDFRTRFSVR